MLTHISIFEARAHLRGELRFDERLSSPMVALMMPRLLLAGTHLWLCAVARRVSLPSLRGSICSACPAPSFSTKASVGKARAVATAHVSGVGRGYLCVCVCADADELWRYFAGRGDVSTAHFDLSLRGCLWRAAKHEHLELLIRVELDAGEVLTQRHYRDGVRYATKETLPYLLGKVDDEKEKLLAQVLIYAACKGHTEKGRIILGELEDWDMGVLEHGIKRAREYGHGDIVDLLEERIRVSGDTKRGE